MAATYPVVGAGRHTFEVHEDWARPPEGCEMIRQKYSKAVSALIRSFNDAWNDKQKSNAEGVSK